MQTHIIAVGRWKASPEKKLFEHFQNRTHPILKLHEVEEKKRLRGPELIIREAELLLKAVPNGACIVALDIRGKNLTSLQLAEFIGGWKNEGIRNTAFLIGGADGQGEYVLQRADLKLSLGPQTWPHLMVRVMIAEQLYRAQSILSGHPYHRA